MTTDDLGVSIIGAVGKSITDMRVITNLYYLPMDPEEIFTDITHWNYVRNAPTSQNEKILDAWLTSLKLSTNGILWASSMNGTIWQNSNNKWHPITTSCTDGLNDLWVSPTNDIFAVGTNGDKVHIINNEITTITDDENRRLNAISGSSNKNIFAVGENGLVLHFDGKQWRQIKLPIEHNLLAVLTISDIETYVAGSNGTIFKWNGSDWEWLGGDGSDLNISSIVKHKDQIFIATGKDGIHIIEPDGPVIFKSLILYKLFVIGENLVGVGNKLLAILDEEGWFGGNVTFHL